MPGRVIEIDRAIGMSQDIHTDLLMLDTGPDRKGSNCACTSKGTSIIKADPGRRVNARLAPYFQTLGSSGQPILGAEFATYLIALEYRAWHPRPAHPINRSASRLSLQRNGMDRESWIVLGVATAIVLGFVIADLVGFEVGDEDDGAIPPDDSPPEPIAEPPPEPEPTPEPPPMPVAPAPEPVPEPVPMPEPVPEPSPEPSPIPDEPDRSGGNDTDAAQGGIPEEEVDEVGDDEVAE